MISCLTVGAAMLIEIYTILQQIPGVGENHPTFQITSNKLVLAHAPVLERPYNSPYSIVMLGCRPRKLGQLGLVIMPCTHVDAQNLKFPLYHCGREIRTGEVEDDVFQVAQPQWTEIYIVLRP